MKNNNQSDIKPYEHLHSSWNKGGVKAQLDWMAGCNWSIVWLNCPDQESLIAFGFTKKEIAAQWAKDNNITIVGVKVYPKGK